MRVEQRFSLRGNEPARFCVHVVEGELCQTPGRIRTLYIDTNTSCDHWIMPEWGPGEAGRSRGILRAVHIATEAEKKGAFFLLDAYDQDPNEETRTKGKRLWLDYCARKRKGEPVGDFGTAWLPQRVKDLASGSAKKAEPWTPPERDEPEVSVPSLL